MLQYEELEIDENSAFIKWIEICSSEYELQGFTLSKIMDSNFEMAEADVIFRISNSNCAEIPSANFSITDDPINYRVVALFDNGTICSDNLSKETFYRFNSMYNQI